MEWLQIVISLVGMFVGPWIAVRMSLKQFRSQKIWEKRSDAYAALLDLLSTIQADAEVQCNAIEMNEGYSVNGERLKELQSAHHEIKRRTAQGSFLISDKAAEALSLFKRETWDDPNDHPYDSYGKTLDAAKKCIATLKIEAAADARRVI